MYSCICMGGMNSSCLPYQFEYIKPGELENWVFTNEVDIWFRFRLCGVFVNEGNGWDEIELASGVVIFDLHSGFSYELFISS